MKGKILKVLVFALVAIMLLGTVSFAFMPYQTYTFSIDGEVLESPMAYRPALSVSASEIGISSSSCTDMVADADGNIYIVDQENCCIVILDENYDRIGEISTYVNENKVTCNFVSPRGIFVTDPEKAQKANLKDQKYIYVADEGKGEEAGRIVVFDENFNYVRSIYKPDSEILSDGAYKPQAVAVDIYGRIFITSGACYEGIIALSPEGNFNGFIGAQSTTATFFEKIFNRFKSAEERREQVKNYSSPYNNITVDDEGFIYATISFSSNGELNSQMSAVTSKSATYSPIKKFNSMGNHILKRNGFFDPGGEVNIFDVTDLSVITDVALAAEGAWTILDRKDSTVYTYDQNGQLLYAFGSRGSQLGSCADVYAMAYQVVNIYDNNGNPVIRDIGGNVVETDINGNVKFFNKATGAEVSVITDTTVSLVDSNGNDIVFEKGYPVLNSYSVKKEYRLLLLDRNGALGYNINVYTPTEYADAITYALYNENIHNHAETIDAWQAVLTQNNNFDLAYIGMGKAYYYQGNYDEAMNLLERAYETSYYSLAFTEWRKDVIGKYMLLVILAVILLVYLMVKFLGWAKKKNKAVSLKVGRKKYWEELIYAFHLIFHPFDGFWDLKHEKRGSVRAASTILTLTVLAFFYQSIGQGYLFNPRQTTSNILVQVFSVALPVILWAISNWCLTTLFDGEGGFKDIYIATCYALTPLPIFVTIGTILTNMLTGNETMIVSLLIGIAVAWMLLLLFFGMLVTHDYSMNKNFVTILATILAAAVIIFVAVLFAGLVTKMYTFVDSLITEISNRA